VKERRHQSIAAGGQNERDEAKQGGRARFSIGLSSHRGTHGESAAQPQADLRRQHRHGQRSRVVDPVYRAQLTRIDTSHVSVAKNFLILASPRCRATNPPGRIVTSRRERPQLGRAGCYDCCQSLHRLWPTPFRQSTFTTSDESFPGSRSIWVGGNPSLRDGAVARPTTRQ
jgi:hypothetical protein